jgi:Flp pilus assembly pilin Flp
MSRMPSNRNGHGFVEYTLIIILIAIVLLSILLIVGNDIREWINDVLPSLIPASG